MISLRVESTTLGLDRAIKDLPDIVSLNLYKTAQAGIQVIQDRTEKGKGYEGRFMKYTPAYAKSKAEGWPKTETRSAFSGDPSGVVNLMVTGNMLGSIIAERKSDLAKIKFARATESKKAFYNNRIRPFFGFNDSEKRALTKFFIREVTQ